MNNSQHPIARLIAAAKIGAGELAIVAQAIAKEARHVHAFGDDPGNLVGKISSTLPPYDPEIHGVTRPGVWVGELAELTYEDDPSEICGDAVIQTLSEAFWDEASGGWGKSLIESWGDEYRLPTPREAQIIAKNYRVLGSSSTSYGDLIVEVEIGTAEQLDRVIVPYQDPMLRGW